MVDVAKAPLEGAPADGAAQEEPQDPFAGFTTEEYERGERVTDPPQPKEADAPKEEEPKPEGEGQSTEPAPEGAEGEEEGGEEGKKPKSVQERINEITRQRHDERRRAEAAEQRAAELQQELERLRSGKVSDAAQPPKVEGASSEQPKEGEPKPDDFEFGELDSRYIAALVAYNTKQAIAEAREQDRQEAAQRAAEAKEQERQTAFVQRAEQGAAKKYPDFVEKVFGELDKYPMSKETVEVVYDSPVGDEIAYHLATHHDEAWKVYQMPPIEQARYLGRLEARFSAGEPAAPANAEEAPTNRAPRAPAPVLPARGAGGKFTAGADTEDFAAFERRVNGG